MVIPAQLKMFKVFKRKFGSRIYQSILQAMRDIYMQTLMTETGMKSWKKSCWQALVLFVIDIQC